MLIIFVNPLFFLATSASKGFQLIFEDILQKLTYFYLCEFLTDFDDFFLQKIVTIFLIPFLLFSAVPEHLPK